MGTRMFDQYTYLHFAVGIIVYFWSISILNWFILHTIFEFLENTQIGINIIHLWRFKFARKYELNISKLDLTSLCIFRMRNALLESTWVGLGPTFDKMPWLRFWVIKLWKPPKLLLEQGSNHPRMRRRGTITKTSHHYIIIRVLFKLFSCDLKCSKV